MLAAAGFSKADVKDWFVARCGRTEADLRRVGKDGVGEGGMGVRSASPTERAPADAFTRILPGREDVPIIVGGARNAGISMVVRIFGQWSNTSVAVERVGEPAAVGGGR